MYIWSVKTKHGEQYSQGSNLGICPISAVSDEEQYTHVIFTDCEHSNFPKIVIRTDTSAKLNWFGHLAKRLPEEYCGAGGIPGKEEDMYKKVEVFELIKGGVSFSMVVDSASGEIETFAYIIGTCTYIDGA